jgi:hypothetical protein
MGAVAGRVGVTAGVGLAIIGFLAGFAALAFFAPAAFFGAAFFAATFFLAAPFLPFARRAGALRAAALRAPRALETVFFAFLDFLAEPANRLTRLSAAVAAFFNFLRVLAFLLVDFFLAAMVESPSLA